MLQGRNSACIDAVEGQESREFLSKGEDKAAAQTLATAVQADGAHYTNAYKILQLSTEDICLP
jgi:hypothetical protein